MSILINKAGVLDTFQDLGRNGKRDQGINPNGAMDKSAVRLINILLGNQDTEAVLELHFPASVIKFQNDANFAIGGANFDATLDGETVENWQTHFAKSGQTLQFNNKTLGNRCYLAIRGGFELEDWLNSKSTNLTAEVGGFEGRQLKKNDEISFNISDQTDSLSNLIIARSLIPRYSNSPTVRIIKGAEYKDLTALSEQILLSDNYKISQDSNRMGFRLEGKALHLLNEKELVSSAVDYGTIQLLPDGQMIALMADHQTTGGYPRIAHIIKKDLPLISQLGFGDNIGFHLITHNEAEELSIQFRKDLDLLKMGVKLKSKL